MKPVCREVPIFPDVWKAPGAFFWAPSSCIMNIERQHAGPSKWKKAGRRTYMLADGILLRPVKPPAIPSSLVAVREPTIAHKLGAKNRIRDSTYSKIF
jgi:hypothetical protein